MEGCIVCLTVSIKIGMEERKKERKIGGYTCYISFGQTTQALNVDTKLDKYL